MLFIAPYLEFSYDSVDFRKFQLIFLVFCCDSKNSGVGGWVSQFIRLKDDSVFCLKSESKL